MTRLGYQIPNFTYPGVGPADLFESIAAQAAAADRSGFDTVLLMDHFYQLPHIGPPDNYMLECYTTLGAIARETNTVRLAALVTGNTYRNPTLLAKTVTALDIVSQGRAQLGIGAGWFELEHKSLGFEFGTFTDRFEKLEEALQIILPMIKGERPTISGEWYHTKEAMAEPRFRDHIPLMIGGRGEKKTFRLAARHFDHLNVLAGFDELPAKLAVLKHRCEEVGRDPATMETSMLVTALVDENASADAVPADMSQRMVVGSADSIADQIKAKVFDAGIDGVVINVAYYSPGVVAKLGEALKPLVAG